MKYIEFVYYEVWKFFHLKKGKQRAPYFETCLLLRYLSTNILVDNSDFHQFTKDGLSVPSKKGKITQVWLRQISTRIEEQGPFWWEILVNEKSEFNLAVPWKYRICFFPLLQFPTCSRLGRCNFCLLSWGAHGLMTLSMPVPPCGNKEATKGKISSLQEGREDKQSNVGYSGSGQLNLS